MGILADWQIRRDIGIKPFAEYDREAQAGKISYGLSSYGYDARVGYEFEIFSPIGAKEIDPKNFDPKALVKVDLTPDLCRWSGPDGQACQVCGVSAPAGVPAGYSRPCPRSRPDHILIPPHSFALAGTLEEFELPRDVLCIVLGKSTLARCGVIVNITPGEPEWRGKWTVEISNTTPLPVRIYAGEGIMQCLFLRTDGYANKLLEHLLKKKVFTSEAELIETLYAGCCEVSYADKKGKYQDQVGLTHPKVIQAKPMADKTPLDPEVINLMEAGGMSQPAAEKAMKHHRTYTGPTEPDGEIVLDNSDPAVPDEVLAKLRTIVRPAHPPAAGAELWALDAPGGVTYVSHPTAPRSPTTAAPPPEPRDPELPPDPPPSDYVLGQKLWVSPRGAGWRYNPKNRTWVQVTEPR